LVTDLEHRLIPNPIILPAILIAGVGGCLQRDPLPTLAGGAIGFASFYLIALARRGGMGGGDVKLAAFIGLASGFPAVLVALIAAILLGGVAALILVVTRVRGLKSYIPYGPFLVAGGFLAVLYGSQIVTWYLTSMAR
jgi:leader peptidase (prepilin peptidase)/N-methyltransferase